MHYGILGAMVAVGAMGAPSGGGAPARWTQAAAIEYAKNLPANSIQPGLTVVPLDSWLREALDVYRLEWFISGCDLKPDPRESAKQRLLCVGARVPANHPVELRFHLVVGNWADGVSGRPYVLNTSFLSCNPVTVETLGVMEPFDSLSALPAALRRARGSCRKSGP
jgi:hypothetical protein